MPADADKVYLKKNKINDLLNDLYTAIAQNKPDNPLEFCIKHFESKLPTPPPPKSSLVDQSSNNAASNNLLNKLFDRAIGGGAGIEASKSLAGSNSPHNVSQQLSNLNIVGKISRIIVKGKKEITEEELLENERIICYSRDDSDNEQQKEAPKIVSFKNDLKNREIAMKHKQELKNLIESIKQEEKKDSGIDLGDDGEEATNTHVQSRSKGVDADDDQQNPELNDEILMPNSYRFVSLTKKKKIKNASINIRKVNANNMQQTLGARQASIAPNVTLVICSVCSKIQSQQNAGNVAKETILEEKTVVNDNINENNNEIDETKSKSPFFEFFKSIQPQQSQPNTARNLEDDNIESASQVSGPRPITPYEPPTNRSINQKEDDIGSKEKELGVLEWVMARQQQSQFINQAKLNELTSKLNINYQELTNKPASNVTKPTDNNKSSKTSNVGSELKWKSNYSSDSDASLKK